jgi:hypothetical protein
VPKYLNLVDVLRARPLLDQVLFVFIDFSTTPPMYLYEMNSIASWSGWVKLEDALAEPGKYDLAEHPAVDETACIAELQEEVDYIKSLFASHTSWEGDCQFYLSAMPTELDIYLVFAIQQGKTGTTYLASPVEYAHLKGYLVVHTTAEG